MEVIATVGISGSGKTTWARQFVEHNPNWVLIDTDDIREELWGDPADQREGQLVFQIAYERTREALAQGYSVVFCATSINAWMRKQLRHIIPKNIKLTFAWIKTDLNTALARNAARARVVPEEVIIGQNAHFNPFSADEEYFIVNT